MQPSLRTRANYKWWVFGSIAIGTFVSVMDTGTVLIALPDIERHFESDLPTVQWVIVGYALAISALILPMGRVGDILGRKYMYIGGLAVFVGASAMAGFAPDLPILIAAKVLQGVGSAMIQGNAMAAIISAFPSSERGKSLGTHLSVVGSGAIAGPAAGGLLVAAFGWRSVFFVNIPVGLLAIAISWYVLDSRRETSGDEGGRPPAFDWPGAVLSGLALLAFLLVVGNGERQGWTSPLITSGILITIALFAAFIWWELHADSPMLDLSLFQKKLVALGISASWLSFLGASASRFLMPFYLQRVLEFEPRDVGLLMIPPAVCMVLIGPVSGGLSDKFGWRGLTVGGLAISAVAWFALAASLTESSPVILIVGMLMVQSTGMALFASPNNSSILSAVDRHQYGVTSALTQLARNSANVTSIAIATTIVVATMGAKGVEPSLDAVSPAVADAFVAGLKWAFWAMGGMLVLGVGITIARGERAKDSAPERQETTGTEITGD